MLNHTTLFILGLSFISVPLFGQDAEVTGTITDKSGAVIVGATVTITNQSTNQSREAITNQTGVYDIPFLVPGLYNLTAQNPGFKAAERKGIELQVSAVVRINLPLELGAVGESVEVTGGAPLVDTANAATGTVVENQRIVELPLNGRDWLSLVALTPNMTTEGGAGNQPASFEGGLRPLEAIAVAGMRVEFNHYTLDGVENTDVNWNSYVVRPSIDALQEFKVETGIYQPEFGKNVTQIDAITKSGTNGFHGTAFDFLRNSDLDAAAWNQIGAKNPYRRNQYGGTLGGPIKRNKLFFLSNYEATKDRLTLQELAIVPTLKARNADFSAVVPFHIINDPATRVFGTSASGNQVALSATPFSNNTIPASRLNPVAVQLMSLEPLPTITSDNYGAYNYVRQAWRPLNTSVVSQRFDWVENEKSTWFGRYTWQGDFVGDQSAFITQQGGTSTTAQQGALGNTYVFSPSVVNEFRMGVNLFANDRVGYYTNNNNIGSQYTSEIQGLPPATSPTDYGIFSVSMAPYTSAIGSSNPFVTRDTTIQANDNVSIVRGKHTMKFGGEIRRDRFDELGNQFSFSSFTFNGDATWNPAARTTDPGVGMADFWLGDISQAQRAFGLADTLLRATYFAGYAQDDWKVSKKLTLNFGLRYEDQDPYHDKYNNIMNVQMFGPGVGPNGLLTPAQEAATLPILTRPGTGSIYQGMLFHEPDSVPTQVGNQYMGRSLVVNDRNNFAPRIGLAYALTDRWVVRAGFGSFYIAEIGNPLFDMGRNLAGRGQFSANVENASQSTFQSPWAAESLPVAQGGSGAVCSNWSGPCDYQTIFAVPYNTRTPYVNEYVFNVQRQLTQNLVLEAGYTGNEAHKLEGNIQANIAIPRTGPGDSRTILQRTPWPQYAANRIYLDGTGFNSNYNALSLKLQQRFSHGLTYMAAYTYSKAIDNSDGPRPATGDQLEEPDNYNLQLNRALSQFDERQRMVISALYELPFGKGKRFLNYGGVIDGVIGGWQIGSILTFADGTPISLTMLPDSSYIDIGALGTYPNATGISPFLSNPTPQKFWNIAAFDTTSSNLQYQYGGPGRNVLRSPGLADWDASMDKNFRIREGQRLEFRFEGFNMSNHPNWITPPTNVLTPSTFGVITAARTMRTLQLALKYLF